MFIRLAVGGRLKPACALVLAWLLGSAWRFRGVVLLWLSSLAVAAMAQTPPGFSGPVSFGVVPQHTSRELARLWTPILTYLHTKTGYDFWLKTATDIPTFEARLASGVYDLAYMNPYHYIVFHQAPGYVAFATEKAQPIQGIVVVQHQSPARTLPDLAGHTIAFPSPAAFAASLLPRAALTAAGTPFTPVYVASHDSVYLSVAQGLYGAGGGILRTFQMTPLPVRDQLHILWTSPPYPSHAFAAHPRVPGVVVERVQHALEAMHRDPEGRVLLQTLGLEGIDAAQDTAWDPVRALQIQTLP